MSTKQQLIEIIRSCKPKGLSIYLKNHYPELYEQLKSLQTTRNLASLTEAIYHEIHSLETVPVCEGLCDKCVTVLKFRSLEYGYTKTCCKCYVYHPDFKAKIQETNLAKYGSISPLSSPEVKEKIRQANLEKHGVEYPMQNKEIQKKSKETLYENYGEEGLANPEIKQKRNETALLKYGVSHHSKLQSTQDRKRDTCVEKYGVDTIMKVPEVAKRVSDTWKNNHQDKLISKIHMLLENRDIELLSEYDHAHGELKLKCKKCDHIYQAVWNNISNGGGHCPKCSRRNSISSQEIELLKLITNWGHTCIQSNRKLIYPYELDLYIPEKNIAIEFCGLWCHSSGGNILRDKIKDSIYHYKKFKMCSDQNIRLITIFEDEWIYQKEIVISKLSYMFNNSNIEKIRASKCQIKIIDCNVKDDFLNQYHLQKTSVSSINLGLYYGDRLVSVITFLKHGTSVYELKRYCNLPHVQVYGGASKMFSHFVTNYEFQEIFSYCDLRWSIGDIYEKLGFTKVDTISPNYWYWGKDIIGRKHRLNFTKKNLLKKYDFDDSYTEFQIMEILGYAWIYDCGNLKYVYKKTT